MATSMRGTRRPRGAQRIHRECETCSAPFWVYASTLRCSNSAGRFCSRRCYGDWLSAEGRQPALRRWKGTAEAAKEASPFCAICGRLALPLEVHHLLPRRVAGGDEDRNLMPFCIQHHRMVEVLTRNFERASPAKPAAQAIAPLILLLRIRQAATRGVLADIARSLP